MSQLSITSRWEMVGLGFVRATAWLSFALLAACASAPPVKHDSLAFLESGHVSRDDVRAHLGASATAFEHGQVLAYRLRRTGDGYDVVVPKNNSNGLGWEGVDYDLVLAFDNNGILQEHSLVAIRGTPGTK